MAQAAFSGPCGAIPLEGAWSPFRTIPQLKTPQVFCYLTTKWYFFGKLPFFCSKGLGRTQVTAE